MDFATIKDAKRKEEEAQQATDTILETLCKTLKGFVDGFDVVSESWKTALNRVVPNKEDPKQVSIQAEKSGLQLDVVFKAMTSANKPAFMRLSVLEADDGTAFIKAQAGRTAHPKLGVEFIARYSEYMQGELNLANASILTAAEAQP